MGQFERELYAATTSIDFGVNLGDVDVSDGSGSGELTTTGIDRDVGSGRDSFLDEMTGERDGLAF